MLKSFAQIPNRDLHIITKSPPEQYSKSKIKFEEIVAEFILLGDYGFAIIVSDDNIRSSICKYI